MTKQDFSLIAASLPSRAGIYKYYDIEDKIIYVGKAKNIYKRVSSYFNKISGNFKTEKLVSEIIKIEFSFFYIFLCEFQVTSPEWQCLFYELQNASYLINGCVWAKIF